MSKYFSTLFFESHHHNFDHLVILKPNFISYSHSRIFELLIKMSQTSYSHGCTSFRPLDDVPASKMPATTSLLQRGVHNDVPASETPAGKPS
jgi:hypothetical protein